MASKRKTDNSRQKQKDARYTDERERGGHKDTTPYKHARTHAGARTRTCTGTYHIPESNEDKES